MKFYGTRNKDKYYSLQQAAFLGLAPCGGLFMPEYIPNVDMQKVEDLASKSFADMALYLASLYFGDDIPEERLKAIVFDAFNFEVPLFQMQDTNKFTLELFHGPTMAFKDFGARFMSRMLQELKGEGDVVVLAATSGDTGSAVASGFDGVEGVKVYILYPNGRVSDFQESQMTTLSENITALRVDASFDDCQRMVKELFADHEFCASHNITSANSISILRWLPQAFYYFYAYCQWKNITKSTKNPEVVVPSGNFGNIAAALIAKKMGLPLGKVTAACNANDTMVNFMKTGKFTSKESIQTLSNAMDIGNPSNFERIIDLYPDLDELKAEFNVVSYSDVQTVEGIQELYKKYGYISDPHSAIGYCAVRDADIEGFWVSTAHNSKFEAVVKDSIGVDVVFSERLADMMTKKRRFIEVKDADTAFLYEILR